MYYFPELGQLSVYFKTVKYIFIFHDITSLYKICKLHIRSNSRKILQCFFPDVFLFSPLGLFVCTWAYVCVCVCHNYFSLILHSETFHFIKQLSRIFNNCIILWHPYLTVPILTVEIVFNCE